MKSTPLWMLLFAGVLLGASGACGTASVDDGDTGDEAEPGDDDDTGDDGSSAICPGDYALAPAEWDPWFTDAERISDISELAGCEVIEGNLSLAGTALTNLDSLSSLTAVGERLWIRDNLALTSLEGLSSLTSVGGDLWIGGNDALTQVDGLWSLTAVGDALSISHNDVLANLDGVANLTSVGHTLSIYDNAGLCQDFVDAFIEACSIGGQVYTDGNDGACP